MKGGGIYKGFGLGLVGGSISDGADPQAGPATPYPYPPSRSCGCGWKRAPDRASRRRSDSDMTPLVVLVSPVMVHRGGLPITARS